MNNFYDIILSKNRNVAVKLTEYFDREPLWEDLNAPNLQGFRDFMLKKLSPNSVKTYISELKAVINLYKGTIDIPCTDLKFMKAKAVKTTHCHLTVAELKKLENLQGLSKRHQDIRNMFLLQAWTGCRISDAIELSKDNIDYDGNILSYSSNKTQVYATIPIKPIVREIIFYRLADIKLYGRSTYNRVISNLCKRAGINQEVKLFKSGEIIKGAKYEFISSHSARRSFATNLYDAGIPITKIAHMMGHTDITMTQRYICSNMDISADVQEFFN